MDIFNDGFNLLYLNLQNQPKKTKNKWILLIKVMRKNNKSNFPTILNSI